MFKKRWSDGLQDDFDHLNEFEFKLGCFGGDGGSSGGGYSGYSGDDVEASYGTSDADISGYEGGGGGSSNDAVAAL